MDTTPEKNVPDEEEVLNFDPVRALEELHQRISDLEAVANAAGHAVEEAPHVPTPEGRRAMGRIYILVVQTARDAEDLLDEADRQAALLGEHMKRHRRGRPSSTAE